MSLDMPKICELCGESIHHYGHRENCPEHINQLEPDPLSSDPETVHVSACPTCGGLAQFVAPEGATGYIRTVDLRGTALKNWIAELPPDAIAQVVNAYRDGWDDHESEPNAERLTAPRRAARAFRDALTSLVGPPQ